MPNKKRTELIARAQKLALEMYGGSVYAMAELLQAELPAAKPLDCPNSKYRNFETMGRDLDELIREINALNGRKS